MFLPGRLCGAVLAGIEVLPEVYHKRAQRLIANLQLAVIPKAILCARAILGADVLQRR